MRIMRRAAALLLVGAATAQAQRPMYNPTLYWETGLIDVPAAWVAPLGGDLAIAVTRAESSRPSVGEPWWYNVSAAASLWGRAEVGASIFTSDLKAAAFGKVLVWDQLDGEFRKGALHWLPSVAIGVRNLGAEKGVDRFSVPRTGLEGTSPTLYAVATRTQVLSRDEDNRPKAQVGVTAGYGNGLFQEVLGADSLYGSRPTGGVFGGVKLDLKPSRFSMLSLLAEHNAWDVNVGALLEVRGLRLGVYVMELGATRGPSAFDQSFQKVALTLGWQTNTRALLRGNQMERTIAQTEAAQEALRREIAAATGRVADLEHRLRTLEGRTAAERQAQQAELERRLKEEQEALKRLQERLGKKP